MLNVVLFGPPGAGKGTQAALIAQQFNLLHLSTGDILRQEMAAQTPLGLEAQKVINAGNLVSDELMIELIKSKIDQNPNVKGFIFDGFPRTTEQAKALDILLDERKIPVLAMISLTVSNEELIKRLLLRGKDSGRADDQNIDVITNRITVYNQKTLPLIDYYEAQQKYYPIQGTGSIEQIFNSIAEVLKFI